jgi:NAD(P)H-dependent FMN reductase
MTARAVAPQGVEAILFEGMGSLPHFNPDDDFDPLPPAVVALRDAIRAADALLVSTPDYAGALPGSFKNLLEWTVGGAALMGKPVAWVNAAAREGAAAGVYESLGRVLGFVGAEVVEEACTRIGVSPGDLDEDGLVGDEAARRRICEVASALAAYVDRRRAEVIG